MMLHREVLEGAPLAGLSKLLSQHRFCEQGQHRLGHRVHVSLLHQQARGPIDNHIRNPGMTGGDHWQAAELRFHHSHGASLTVSIRGHDRVLHEGTHLTHPFRHLLLRTDPGKHHIVLQLMLNNKPPRFCKQRALSHHP